jgi:hypothetical protein
LSDVRADRISLPHEGSKTPIAHAPDQRGQLALQPARMMNCARVEPCSRAI